MSVAGVRGQSVPDVSHLAFLGTHEILRLFVEGGGGRGGGGDVLGKARKVAGIGRGREFRNEGWERERERVRQRGVGEKA